MCDRWPNCGHISRYGVTPADPRMQPGWQPPEPSVSVEQYVRGMELEGGLKLYGNKKTAILHDPDTGLDIHHHDKGGGSLNFRSKRLLLLNDD